MHPRPMPPLVPGHEIFGHIETVGSNTNCSLHARARVVIYPLIFCGRCAACLEGDTHVCERLGLISIDCDGGFAEFVKVKPHQLVAVPNEICDEEAALVSRSPLLCMP